MRSNNTYRTKQDFIRRHVHMKTSDDRQVNWFTRLFAGVMRRHNAITHLLDAHQYYACDSISYVCFCQHINKKTCMLIILSAKLKQEKQQIICCCLGVCFFSEIRRYLTPRAIFRERKMFVNFSHLNIHILMMIWHIHELHLCL